VGISIIVLAARLFCARVIVTTPSKKLAANPIFVRWHPAVEGLTSSRSVQRA